jgi:chromosome segregation ATPase
MLNDLKKLITDLRQELDTEKSKSKAAPDALAKEQIEAHIATARDEANKEAATKAQGSIDAMKTSMKEQFETAIKNRQMQMQAQVQQHLKTQMEKWRVTEQRYKDDIAALESKLSAATKQIEWHGQRLAAAPNAIQHSHQRPTKHAQEVSPQEMFKPSKRRRLDSFG